MPAIRAKLFSGMFPLRDVRLLPDEAASDCSDVDTAGGAVDGVTSPGRIALLNPSTNRVYRIPLANASDLSKSFWMQFDDPDTDVCRTPIVNDSFERYYWASPSRGIRYSTKARIIAGQTDYRLGVQRPGTGMVVTPGGSTPPLKSRSYVVTYVSIYGEESQPSNPVNGNGGETDTWVLSLIPQPVNDPDKAPIEHINIYRTTTATSGTTTFFKVAEIPAGQTVFNDNLTTSKVTGQGQLLSTIWASPPADLQGIVEMPNGIFVGWTGNTLRFSENYRPHAWPEEYALTVQYPIVGLGVFGNTCVICTAGHPAVVTGSKPNSMSIYKEDTSLPCLSRGSIVSADGGVYYATEVGLVFISPNGIHITTSDLIGRDLWAKDFAPATIRAMYIDGRYTATRVADTIKDGFSLQPNNQQSGVIRITKFGTAKTLFIDPWSGKSLYVATDESNVNYVFEWRPSGGARLPYTWKSKEFHMAYPMNMSTSQMFFDEVKPSTVERNQLRVWADRRLVFTGEFEKTGEERRLPSGFLATVWQFEVYGVSQIHSVHIATTSKELRDID